MEDYRSIIKAAGSDSIKAMQLAAQLIPRFFKFFPELSDLAVDSHIDLCEADELGVSVSLYDCVTWLCYCGCLSFILEAAKTTFIFLVRKLRHYKLIFIIFIGHECSLICSH